MYQLDTFSILSVWLAFVDGFILIFYSYEEVLHFMMLKELYYYSGGAIIILNIVFYSLVYFWES